MDFKKNNSLEKRKELSANILQKYPDKIPIIIEPYKGITIKKEKFIVNKVTEFAYFQIILRKFLNVKDDQAIFLFVNNCLIPGTETLGSIYQRHHSEDGFLYCVVSIESTFG